MKNLLKKYWALPKIYQFCIAAVVFVCLFLVLPNVIAYIFAAAVSYDLIDKKVWKYSAVSFLAVVAFSSGVLWIDGKTDSQPVESSSVTQSVDSAEHSESNQKAKTTNESATTSQNNVAEVEASQGESSQQDNGDEAETDITGQEENNEQDDKDEDSQIETESNQVNEGNDEISQDSLAENDSVDEPYEVVDVVDGDTVKLSIDDEVETIRLIGIDTPETVHPSEPVECFGKEASNKAKELLSGKTVVLEADESQGTRDAYGRLLGYVILPGGRNFNKLMIEQGYAYEYTYSTPYKYQDAFKTAEQNARTSEVGLWADGACDDWEEKSEQEDQTSDSTTSEGNWYVSSHHSSKYYYCEESDGWKSLSESYLKVYESESALLADFPNHTLHESCE
ncbi:MAG: thermonuclease family protein [Candidatus Paceibacterota bacterium]